MIEHNFHDDLARSHAASDLSLWLEIYRQAFPTLQVAIDHREDGEHQRAGIDRSLILANSKQILIDEKIRWPGKNGRIYHDILLEYVSNDRYNTPGWVCKPLRADYICYGIAAVGRGYLLPVPQLQQAWSRHGAEWLEANGTRTSPNQGYNTLNCPVAVRTLFAAIGDCLRVPFTPIRERPENC